MDEARSFFVRGKSVFNEKPTTDFNSEKIYFRDFMAFNDAWRSQNICYNWMG